jgi:hypothetical protein
MMLSYCGLLSGINVFRSSIFCDIYFLGRCLFHSLFSIIYYDCLKIDGLKHIYDYRHIYGLQHFFC